MLKPLALVALLIAGAIGAGWWLSVGYIHRDALGRPLDHPGETVPCPTPKCGNPRAANVSDYTYRCERCGIEFSCRLNEDKTFRFEPDTRED